MIREYRVWNRKLKMFHEDGSSIMMNAEGLLYWRIGVYPGIKVLTQADHEAQFYLDSVDYKGHLVCEGDFVEHYNGYLFVVEWSDYRWVLKRCDEPDTHEYLLNRQNDEQFTIVGNIFEGMNKCS